MRRMMAAHIAGIATSYATIQAAVNAALPGATISVDAGTYAEQVTIDKPLTLRGANAGVDARGTRAAESVVLFTPTDFNIIANDVTIDGFTVQGYKSNIGAGLGAGIIMGAGIHGTHVVNNIIQNNVTGLYLSNNSDTDGALIRHNYFYNNTETGADWTYGWNGSRAIYTDGSLTGGLLTNVLIDGNKFYRDDSYTGEGLIALAAATAGRQFNITISGNTFNAVNGDSSKAVLSFNVTNLTVIGNTMTNMNDGSSGPLRFEGNANNVNIQYNSIYNNPGPGIAVDSAGVAGDSSGFVVNNNNIYNNTVSGATYGIGFISIANVYNGPVIALNDWWGSASGPSGLGTGTGQQVWANGISGHYTNPSGAPGGQITFAPWATAPIDITQIPIPAPATALTASPAAAGQLTLAWTAPYSTALGQVIQRSSDGINFTTVATVAPLVNTFTDTGLSTGVTYTYRVYTYNNTGTAAASNTAAAVPPAYQPPTPANGIAVTSNTGSTIGLRWNTPSYPYGIAGYTVYRNGTAIGTTATQAFTDTGATPNAANVYTVVTTDSTGATSAPSAAFSVVAGPTQLQDGSFELTPWADAYRPATANWTFTGLSAIESPNGAFGTATGTTGAQFAVIQGNAGSVGAITQSFTVNPGGTFTISFDAAQRPGHSAEPVTVTVDGTLLGTFTPASNTFVKFTTAPFALAAGTHQITFSGTVTQNDYDSFIDAVSLNQLATAATSSGQFQDASFEQTPWSYTYAPTTANWLFTGNAAIAGNNTAFGAANAPAGTQSVFLQGVNGGTIGAVTQTVAVTAAGQYAISFAAAQRANYGLQPIAVFVDGQLVATVTPASTAFAIYTTPLFSLTAGSHKFTFSGTTNVGDSDSFLDAVSLNRVATTTTPAAPVLFTAAGGSASTANLYWSSGGPGTTGFTVLRSANGINWTAVATGLAATATAYVDTALAPATTYSYMIVALSGTAGSVPATASATTLPSAAVATPLSRLAWTSATSGYKTVQRDASVQGNALTLNGTTYATGLGTSAASVITYNLGGTYNAFAVDVGIDGEVTAPSGLLASVDFQVLGDGRVLFDSGNLGLGGPTVHVAVPVAGVQVLTLVATNGVAGIAYDHADWAGATLYANPSVPAAPTGLAAVGVGTNSIGLTWAPASAAVTGYAVDRSTDGTTFTTVATGLAGASTSWTDLAASSTGTSYSYRIRAINAAGASGNSAVASAVTLAYVPTSVPLTTLAWTSATAGYGTVQKNASIAGNTLNLHGTTYATGIGTHAASVVTYGLAGKYNVFSADVGIDYEENGVGNGSVDFQVLGDGKLLYDSGVLTGISPTTHFAVNVTGVKTLTLLATNGVAGSIDFDHADWAGATLSTITAAPAPTGLTATLGGTSGSLSVALSWAAAASSQVRYTVQRSTDGVTFTSIAASLSTNAYTDAGPLAAGTTYVYRVLATTAQGTSPASGTASVTTPVAAGAVSTYLSDLTPTSATTGYGVVMRDASVGGNPITLGGVTYAKGMGVHAVSNLVYNLAGQYTTFTADVGVDDEENGKGTGTVDFQVIGDGVVLFDSGPLQNGVAAKHLSVSVAGVKTLTLLATNGVPNDISYDHADWAGATLIGTPTVPSTPANVVATAQTATMVKLTWTPGSTNATSYAVDRSTDGTTFTTVATTIAGSATAWVDPTALSPGTKYTYRIRAVNGAGASANSAVATVTTPAKQTATYLSDLTATSSTIGYGTVQRDASVAGNAITLAGVTYAKGIGTHAVSTIAYNLNGAYTTFVSTVGVDDEVKGAASVDFQVYGDGVLLFDSGALTNGQTASIAVSVAGVKTLTLVATNGIPNSIDYDHADWAGAQVLV